ncbi:FAD-binding protein [Cryobacterium frigoriphilum]|uniref:FAD-binding protein n=1 Tax=Cryobacterium frigoriphilum TaxID=1259150 RepID=A0A4R8ZYR4_9MICO|nr:FAD-binding protein [Cryobacterium frigoriphilum]
MTAELHNWAGNLTYATTDLRHPATVEELCEIVAGSVRVKALGSRHSFNDSADTTGTLVALDRLQGEIELDTDPGTGARIVSVGAGVTHARLGAYLEARGLALHNLASLPHISVAGAIQTGTHGSGVNLGSLAAKVTAFDIVRASGVVETLRRGDDRFEASLVGIGALGIVTNVTLETEPSFQIVQHVHEDLPWAAALPHWADIMAGGYSVSVFTTFVGENTQQILTKRRVDGGRGGGGGATIDLAALGGREAGVAVHPFKGAAASNVTEQLRVAGPWNERLPHFRSDFQPSLGTEIQSEYLVPIDNAVPAIEALRAIGHLIQPLLYVAELRTVAADAGWLSPSYARDSFAVHFTWHQRHPEVLAVLPHVERALAPFNARPHWGKVATLTGVELRRVYPRLDAFALETLRVDPQRRFANAFLERTLFA